MSIFEIISAIVLIIACVFIVIVVLVKDTKTQMSQTISGTSSDSFYQKNAGRTKEAMLNKATIAAAIIFFVLAVLVNLFNVYSGKNKAAAEDNTSGTVSVVESSDVSDVSEDTSAESDESAASGSDTAESDASSEENSAGDRALLMYLRKMMN